MYKTYSFDNHNVYLSYSSNSIHVKIKSKYKNLITRGQNL